MTRLESLSSGVYGTALSLLSQHGEEMERLFKAIVDFEKNHPSTGEFDGWEWHQVFGDPRTLNSLVTKRVVKVLFKSNKSTMYKAVDLEALEKSLAGYAGSFLQEAETEEDIPPDLFNIVIAHEDKKEIILRSLKAERPVHCLLWGTIASGKTLFEEELARLPRSRFVLGSSLTRAGVFDVLFNERPRYLILDELDKVDGSENLAALLSLMERGLVTETKYKRHQTIRLKTWVFASANEIAKLPRELLSRFLLLRFRDYTPEEFIEVSVKVLSERENLNENLGIYIADTVMKTLFSKDIRDCVKIARLMKDKNREDVDKIMDILKKQK